MSEPLFKGVGTALVTPMNKDGSINFHKLSELVDYQINNGVSAIIACGTTGEGPTLNDAEHIAVIKEVINVVNKRVPVIAGTGSNDTNYAIHLSQEAQSLGADGLLSITPYYNKASQQGLIYHFNAIADSVSIPIILYNVPSRTGTNIQPETYYELSKHKNIQGIKEANGDISSVAYTQSLCRGSLSIYSGNDDQTVAMIALGGHGVISVLSNIAPREVSKISELALNGDFKGALDLQNDWIRLMNDMFIDVNPIMVKEAMNIMGFDVGHCRLPLCATSDKKRAELTDALQVAGLI